MYLSKVKAVLGKELSLENGSSVDGLEHNGKTNGFANGSHKDEDSGNITMGEDDSEAVKSPGAPKGKGGRRSKANSDSKSKFYCVF